MTLRYIQHDYINSTKKNFDCVHLVAQTDIIEQAASVSLLCSEQVDQSILARAFRGELVECEDQELPQRSFFSVRF